MGSVCIKKKDTESQKCIEIISLGTVNVSKTRVHKKKNNIPVFVEDG